MQDQDRCSSLVAEHNGIILDYSRQNLNSNTMDKLFDLAAASGLETKRSAMINGDHINTAENRSVMHIALRSPKNKQLYVDGNDVVPEVHEVLEKVQDFTNRVRRGVWLGCTGKQLTNVVSIGFT